MPMTEAEKRERRLERSNLKMLDRIEKAGNLTKTMSPNGGNSGSYFSFPDGREAKWETVVRLIESGRLKSAGDGLFDDGQTFVVS